ncbi:MAG: GldM family protein [Saprospiraceae bacterium]
MSIPKEPRQLMINIMYLVLTAMLALNVSAEIMNAFWDLNNSLEKSNSLTAESVKSTKIGIQGILEKKPKLQEPLNAGIDAVRSDVSSFVDEIQTIKDYLIDESGDKDGTRGEGDFNKGLPKGKKDKDLTTRYLVKAGKGDEIEAKVNEIRAKLIATYETTMNNPEVQAEARLTDQEIADKIKNVNENITIGIDDSWKDKAKKDKNSWAEYKFKQMPVIAVLPVLTKLQTDARNSEATIVNKLAELVGGREIKLNKFFPVINAKKGYVIKGEKFEAEVSIGAYSSEFSKTSSITVNGQRISLNAEGKGKFTETANSYGKKKLKLTANVTNPLTGDKFTESSEFEYEVGERSATVSADQMNVFYIGVENPISVAVAGANSNDVKVSGQGVSVKGSRGKYVVTATKPTGNKSFAKINVAAPGLGTKGFDFRVKRIPNPIPVLGAGPNKSGGAMGNGEFKAQGGLATILENFDFNAKCAVQGYELTRVAKRQDPVSAANRGARYNDKAKRLVMAAKPGDTYYFDNVKSKCPGDPAGRKLSSIVFVIK